MCIMKTLLPILAKEDFKSNSQIEFLVFRYEESASSMKKSITAFTGNRSKRG